MLLQSTLLDTLLGDKANKRYYKMRVYKLYNRESIIKNCFNSWIIKDISMFRNSFADNAVYIESCGPAYRNIVHIETWFRDWNVNNSVLVWDIISFFHSEDICICEWYFECKCNVNVDGFNGVSVIS